jgi:hypothetical protein
MIPRSDPRPGLIPTSDGRPHQHRANLSSGRPAARTTDTAAQPERSSRAAPDRVTPIRQPVTPWLTCHQIPYSVVPLKTRVRTAEGLQIGDVVAVRLTVDL